MAPEPIIRLYRSQVRSSNAEAVGFYQRIGYGIDAVISLGKRH